MFAQACEQTHKHILAGKCPWCGGGILEGRPFRYVDGLLDLDDEWLRQNLKGCREGDIVALSSLNSACQQLFLEHLHLLIVVKIDTNKLNWRALTDEFNRVIGKLAMTFEGASVFEFWQMASQELRRQWTRLIDET